MRLIDADALSDLLVKTYEKAPTEKALLFVSLLLKNNEEVPTVEERPQGEWIEGETVILSVINAVVRLDIHTLLAINLIFQNFVANAEQICDRRQANDK